MSQLQPRHHLLRTLPVNLFGGVMSLTALSLAWALATRSTHAFQWIADVFGFLAILFFLLLVICYAVKWALYRKEVITEFNHPAHINFFATIAVSFLLVPVLVLSYSLYTALVLWSMGAAGMFLLAWRILLTWLKTPQDPINTTPAWLLPVVGTLDVPVAGLQLPFDPLPQICLFFFAIGVVFTLILFPILFSRMFFLAALPDSTKPTLMILIGPFALAFSGYTGFTGHVDRVASMLYYFNLFLFIVLVSKLYYLPLKSPFHISWWAVGFPLGALTIASLHFAVYSQTILFDGIAWVLLAGTTVIILYLLTCTLLRWYKGFWEIPLPPPETKGHTKLNTAAG